MIHPGTGRVCVPIDTKSIKALEKFDPLGVPTVIELLGEIDEWDARHGREGGGGNSEAEAMKKVPDYEKTSLKPYVEYFRDHVVAMLKDEKGVKREREDGDEMEF